MCGIVGIWDPREGIDAAELNAFTDALSHRGPDGRGIHIEGPIGLGHRRLAILDTSSAGHQPMAYGGADGRRFWITYNGEIYNFLELRAELAARGHVFRTQSDTEVILAAFEAWGRDAVSKFNGMFAFAIWDSAKRELLLVRDRFGVKPLYFGLIGQRLVFASELKAFLSLSGFVPELNHTIAHAAVQSATGYEANDVATLMQGVNRLTPGHILRVDASGRFDIFRWWDTATTKADVPARYDDQVAAFRALLEDAVKIRLRSDVPIGTCLSGGVDSSAVAGVMAHVARAGGAHEREAGGDRHAFIASFPGSAIDETRFADEVARHTGVTPHHWRFDSSDTVTHVLDGIWSNDEIHPGITVPMWSLYRQMRRENVVVSLDGHGGDEVYGGYPWHLDVATEKLNERLFLDTHINVLPAILRNYDRAAMAHGVEVRMPLLDWRLVTFAFALPASSRIGGGYTKRILRDAVKGLIPESIRLRRQKIGFNAPLIELFNGGLAPLIEKIIATPLWREAPYLEGAKLTPFIAQRTRDRSWTMADWYSATQIWARFNIVLWHALFVERDVRTFGNLSTA